MGEIFQPPFRGAGKILIRSANWVGDAVMSLPALASLRRGLPSARVSILAKPWVAGIYEGFPGVDEVILYRSPGVHEGLRGKWRLARELRKGGFDLAVHLPNSFESALLSFLAGIRQRAGFSTDGRGILLTHRVPVNGGVKEAHQTEYYLHLVRALGLPGSEPVPSLRVSPEKMAEAEKILRALGAADRPILGLSPGAKYGSAKEWFAERFGDLALRAVREMGARVLVLGSAADREAASRIEEIAGGGAAVDLTGKTTLGQAMALILRCRVFVTNDSGLMHLASALGVPLVAIFGSTDPSRTGPRGPGSRVVFKALPCAPCLKKECPRGRECMEAVTVEEVFQNVRALWEEPPRRENPPGEERKG